MLHKIKYSFSFNLTLILVVVVTSCNKKDLLDEKPKSNLVIPATLEDFQALLDAQSTMNQTPPIDAAADNYYMTNTAFSAAPVQSRNVYTWSSDIYQGKTNIDEWNIPYSQVFVANVILEGLSKLEITSANQQAWNNMKGSALFYRAYAFFNAAQLFAPVYDSATANTDLGIALRLKSDINETSIRATLKQTYDQILSDLSDARNLLSGNIPFSNKNRPSKPAAYALTARVFLSMRNYKSAGVYADTALQQFNTLLDYNVVPTSTSFYFPFSFVNNPEVFFNSYESRSNASPGGFIVNILFGNSSDQYSVDTILYQSYGSNDLRKTVFYFKRNNGAIRLEGTYAGTSQMFTGFATDEMYLIRAECNARSGNTTSAMKDLNDLIRTRFRKIANVTTYVDQTATDATDALNKILIERRKELAFRGVRWSDLRRLNKEGYNITLTRIVNNQTYTLQPNDKKYVYPIPPDVIQLSGMQQNPR